MSKYIYVALDVLMASLVSYKTFQKQAGGLEHAKTYIP